MGASSSYKLTKQEICDDKPSDHRLPRTADSRHDHDDNHYGTSASQQRNVSSGTSSLAFTSSGKRIYPYTRNKMWEDSFSGKRVCSDTPSHRKRDDQSHTSNLITTENFPAISVVYPGRNILTEGPHWTSRSRHPLAPTSFGMRTDDASNDPYSLPYAIPQSSATFGNKVHLELQKGSITGSRKTRKTPTLNVNLSNKSASSASFLPVTYTEFQPHVIGQQNSHSSSWSPYHAPSIPTSLSTRADPELQSDTSNKQHISVRYAADISFGDNVHLELQRGNIFNSLNNPYMYNIPSSQINPHLGIARVPTPINLQEKNSLADKNQAGSK